MHEELKGINMTAVIALHQRLLLQVVLLPETYSRLALVALQQVGAQQLWLPWR